MKELKNKKILITSGPTRSYIDDIRYITNTSTGKLGSIIAEKFLKKGARITFIYGKNSKIPNIVSRNLRLIEITTTSDLLNTVFYELKRIKYDIIIHVAGVLDYECRKIQGKIKSENKTLTIKLVRTPKIIENIKSISRNSFLVGFKLESGISKNKLIDSAYNTLQKSKADLIVANDLRGIKQDEHEAFIIDRNKKIIAKANTKEEIAEKIVDIIMLGMSTTNARPTDKGVLYSRSAV